jgi:hypothetical protein
VSQAREELAERQLRRLGSMSGGAIQVISGPFPSQRRGWLAFDISLDLAGMNTTPGGIAIRARERFLVAVGPTYPFVAPDVYSAHTRWAGSPHVNWANQICLYLAPAQEWAPEDGMRGLIDRLIDWLSGLARNFVGGLGPGGGVVEVEAAGAVEGVFGGAGG